MKNIFSKINRFHDIEFNTGEQFKFTLKSVHEEDTHKNIEVVNSDGNSAVMKIGYTYRIRVKKYMTEPSTPSFDFMHRFNNDVPMPFVEMVGDVIGETRGMFKMKLHGELRQTDICMMCGKPLTNPISRLYGLGPECGAHFYINPFNTEEDLKEHLDEVKSKIKNVTWEGWVIKSAIKEFENIS